MIMAITFIVLVIIAMCLLIWIIKSKKYKALIIITAIILIIICISYYLYAINIHYKVIYNGYISNFDNIIISNIDEYNEFMINFNENYKKIISSKKYDKKYFENKSLALIYIFKGSSQNTFNGIDLSYNDDTLIIKTGNIENKGITMDITGSLILVEVDKNITKIEFQK